MSVVNWYSREWYLREENVGLGPVRRVYFYS